jgi:hypothetical protein
MRPLLYLLSFALMLPGLLLASGFIVLGHAIAGGTLVEFFMRLLSELALLVDWGILAALAFLLAVLTGGLFVRTRWLAAACVAVLAAASAIVLIALGSHPFSEGRWVVLLPGIASLWMSAWLALREWRRPAPSSVEGLGDPR